MAEITEKKITLQVSLSDDASSVLDGLKSRNLKGLFVNEAIVAFANSGKAPEMFFKNKSKNQIPQDKTTKQVIQAEVDTIAPSESKIKEW